MMTMNCRLIGGGSRWVNWWLTLNLNLLIIRLRCIVVATLRLDPCRILLLGRKRLLRRSLLFWSVILIRLKMAKRLLIMMTIILVIFVLRMLFTLSRVLRACRLMVRNRCRRRSLLMRRLKVVVCSRGLTLRCLVMRWVVTWK